MFYRAQTSCFFFKFYGTAISINDTFVFLVTYIRARRIYRESLFTSHFLHAVLSVQYRQLCLHFTKAADNGWELFSSGFQVSPLYSWSYPAWLSYLMVHEMEICKTNPHSWGGGVMVSGWYPRWVLTVKWYTRRRVPKYHFQRLAIPATHAIPQWST